MPGREAIGRYLPAGGCCSVSSRWAEMFVNQSKRLQNTLCPHGRLEPLQVSLRWEEGGDELSAGGHGAAWQYLREIGSLQRMGQFAPGTHHPWETRVAPLYPKRVEAFAEIADEPVTGTDRLGASNHLEATHQSIPPFQMLMISLNRLLNSYYAET